MGKKAFIPLSVPNLGSREQQLAARCISSNWVSSAGSFVDDFEKEVCRLSSSRYAVACVNATSGLFISLKACGVSAGDEVIVPTLTFIAPVNAVRYLGAEPVFMDCDDCLQIDPVKTADFLATECRRTPKGLKNRRSGRYVRAILPVHVFGTPCRMEAMVELGRTYGLPVVEDAAESIGAYYSSGRLKGRHTGTIGRAGVYSFNGNKIITTGSGGMIVTSDRTIGDTCRYLTTQAKDDPVRYIHDQVGYNFRLSNIQSALGLAQLEKLKSFIAIKKSNFNRYCCQLGGVDGISLLYPPAGVEPNYWFYTLLVDRRNFGCGPLELMKYLAGEKIQTRPLWYLNHLQKPYRHNQSYRIENALKFLDTALNLPCSTDLREEDVIRVCRAIIKKRGGR